MLRLQNVGMRYGTGPEVLRDIDLSLKVGSFHFLTGPSGAGKSSLLKLMFLAARPSRGIMTIFGEDVIAIPRRRLPLLRRRIGVVFQDFRLLDHMTALDNVALPLRIKGGLSESEIRDYVGELLAWVGLGAYLDARPPVMSGGEQQRVAIARAVVTQPRLLLADEPTGNVDATMGRRLLYLFTQLNKLGTTIVIATHDDALVERMAKPRLQLLDGALVACQPAGTVG